MSWGAIFVDALPIARSPAFAGRMYLRPMTGFDLPAALNASARSTGAVDSECYVREAPKATLARFIRLHFLPAAQHLGLDAARERRRPGVPVNWLPVDLVG